MHTDTLKQKAIKLRKQGYSYSEISNITGIAQGTCSAWLSSIDLPKSAVKILRIKGRAGQMLGLRRRIDHLEVSYRTISKIVAEDISSLSMDRLTQRLLCAFLYWGEGAKTKKDIRFMNSDPEMIKVFLHLFRSCFSIKEDKLSARLHLHQYHDTQERLQFWSKVTKIPSSRIGIYCKPNSGHIIRAGYPGCISINYADAKIFTALTSYYKLFATVRGLV